MLRKRSSEIFIYWSSLIDEVIRAVLDPLIFFYKKILHTPKTPKAQKALKTQKAQKRN